MHTLFIMIVGALLAAAPQTRPSETSREPEVRVMSFNIRYGKAADGDDHWEKRKELVFDVIRKQRPDIVGLQEALRFQLDEMRKALPDFDEIGVGRDNGQDKGEYNTIFYRADRLKVLESGTFWYSDTPDVPGSKHWGNDLPRLCTWVRLQFRDRPEVRFYHFNTHLDHRSQPSREKSAQMLLNRVRTRAHVEPVIVTGDFNAGEKNPAIATLTGQGITSGPALGRMHLVDTFRALHPDAKTVGTFNGFKGTRDGEKIDYILVSPLIKTLAAEIVYDNTNGRYPSDHFPITAIVRLPVAR